MWINLLPVCGIASCEVLNLRNVARLIICHQNSHRRGIYVQLFISGERGCMVENNLLPTIPVKHFEFLSRLERKDWAVQYKCESYTSFQVSSVKTEHGRRTG